MSERSDSPQHLRKASQESRTSPISPEPPVAPEHAPSPPSPAPAPKSQEKSLPTAPDSKEILPTRWDKISGEPTTKPSGRTGQVNPQNTTFHKPSGSTASTFLHWGREQLQSKKFAQARSRISSFSKNEPSIPQASYGRSSPHRFLRPESPDVHLSGRESPFESNEHLGFVPTTVTTITSAGREPQRPYSRSRRERSSEPKRDLNLDVTPLGTSWPAKPAVRFGSTTILPDVVNTGSSSSTESFQDVTQQDLHETAAGAPPGNIPNTHLVNAQESIREDTPDSEPMPTSTEDTPSIMSRQRPIPNANAIPTSRKPVRKPTPSENPAGPEVPAQTPTTDNPKDPQSRIGILEAKRDELKKRRMSLETLVDELSRAIQPGPGSLSHDMAAKAEVKKSLQSMENEIAEIKREEHDLGLKISRAWKRWDEQENNGDGSNLWIKRVTS